MARLDWTDLPAGIRARVERVAGSVVTETHSQPGGFSAGLASRVTFGDGRRLFVKAVQASSPGTFDLYEREADILRVADLEIDVLRRRVTRGATRIDLTAKEFALLHLLAKRQGEVLSRTQIASMVWDMNFDSDTNVVDVAIRRLRAKVDDPYPLKLVQTVRGMGYLLEARE